MADNTHIEWADATWQPITGCSVVSPGCTNCYAMRLAGTRLQHHPSRQGLTRDTNAGPVWNGEVRFNENWLDQPLRWKRPRRIFVCAHGDLLAENVPDDWIDRVFAVMALCPQHTFQVLTKRAQRMRDYLRGLENESNDDPRQPHQRILAAAENADFPWTPALYTQLRDLCEMDEPCLPLPNVWLGVSVEDQARADERIPLLLDTPAARRFISAEPLLGPVELAESWICYGYLSTPDRPLDWVIAGGESGPGARPMLRCWAQSLRDQCRASGVAFFYKQTGEWIDADELIGLIQCGEYELVPGERFTATKPPLDFTTAAFLADFSGKPYEHQSDGSTLIRLGKKAAGRLLDGREWNEFPDSHSPDAGDDGTARAHR